MELRNCTIVNGHAYGCVYGNPKFEDGMSVVTSRVTEMIPKGEYTEIHTENSVYKGFMCEN